MLNLVATTCRRLPPSSAGMLLAVLACTAGQTEPDPQQPPTGLRSLTIRGRVGDSLGVPFGGVLLRTHVAATGDATGLFGTGWQINGDGMINRTFYEESPALQRDFSGTIAFTLTGTGFDGPCRAFEDSGWVQPYQRPARIIDDTVEFEVVLRSRPLPAITPGGFCGIGTDFGWLYLNLNIDSLADSVFGHWDLGFSATIGSRYGVFAGDLQKTTLLLELTDTLNPSCPDWRFTAPVDSISRVIYPGWLTNCDGRPVPGRFWLRPGNN